MSDTDIIKVSNPRINNPKGDNMLQKLLDMLSLESKEGGTA